MKDDPKISGYLIFSHTGQDFTYIDVEKISDNAQQCHQDKSNDGNKTGYKGIGFKSIFSISDMVEIISNGYNIRFDKNYVQWIRSAQVVPWPIIPIWTEENEIPAEVRPYLNRSHVNFIIAVNKDPNISIANEFKFIAEHPSIVLFLRNVQSIELAIDRQEKMIRLDRESYRRTIYINNDFHSSWIVKEIPLKIPDIMKKYLVNLNEHQCPDRLKKSIMTKITFAAQLDKDQNIVQLEQSYLYSTLPTKVDFELPYLINGDFLLNADRTRLVENLWNAFLLCQLACYQFTWLVDLTKDQKIRYQILKLMSSEFIHHDYHQFNESFHAGFKQGFDTIAFIPKYLSNQLLTTKQVIIDETGFYQYAQIPPLEGELADYQLADLEIFQYKYGIKKINLNKILENLPKHAETYNNILFQCSVIKYLYGVSISKNISDDFREKVKKTRFLLAEDKTIDAPRNLYYKSTEAIPVPPVMKIKFIDLELWNSSQEIQNYLSVLGVREATPSELIRGYILQLITDKQITPDNVIPITIFCFETSQRNLLSDEAWQVFQKLPVLTKRRKLISARDSYLSDDYQPDFKLENILLKEDIFISEMYIKQNPPAHNHLVNAWKQFFIRLDVKSDIRFFLTQNYAISDAIAHKGESMTRYLDILKARLAIPFIQNYHKLDNFLDFNVIQYIQFPEFANPFWKKMISNWEFIIQNHGRSQYRKSDAGLGMEIPISYLQYFLQNTKCIPGTDDKMHNTSELYLPRFRMFHKTITVAAIDVDFTEKQAEFFGFKNVIQLDDCLKLLTDLNKNGITDINQYSLIMQSLLKLPLTDADMKQLRCWNVELPAQNGTLQPIKKLRCFAIKNKSAPHNSDHWLRNFANMSFDDLIKLSELLGINIVSIDQLQFTTVPPHETLSENIEPKKTLQQRLPLIARVEAHTTGMQEREILIKLWKIVEQLKFFHVQSMALSYREDKAGTPINAYLDSHHHLYFKDNWRNLRHLNDYCCELNRELNLSADTVRYLGEILCETNMREWLAEKFSDSHGLLPLPGEEGRLQLEPKKMATFEFVTKQPLSNLKSPVIETTPIPVNPIDQPKLDTLFRSTDLKQTATYGELTQIVIDNSFQDEEINNQVGWLGEAIVFKKLKLHYQLRYKSIAVQTADGFTINGTCPHLHTVNLSLIWHNINNTKDTSDRDMTITKLQTRMKSKQGKVVSTEIVKKSEVHRGEINHFKLRNTILFIRQ